LLVTVEPQAGDQLARKSSVGAVMLTHPAQGTPGRPPQEGAVVEGKQVPDNSHRLHNSAQASTAVVSPELEPPQTSRLSPGCSASVGSPAD